VLVQAATEHLALTGWLAAAAGFALSLFPPFPLQHHALADLPYYVVFAIAIADLADVPLRGIAARIAEFSGDISFGVYLWHWPFLMVMHPKTPAELAAFLALVMSTATTSLRYFERPAQSLARNIASAWLDGPA
jgi:peptidoglycan/LPS O-acetylase OafA/YrhL